MKRTHVFPVFAAACCWFSGCDATIHALVAPSQTIRGSGQPATREAPVEDFREVEVLGALKAVLAFGDTPKVVVRGDDNIVPLVEIRVDAGRLTIRPQPDTSYSTVTTLEIEITARALASAHALGASTIELPSLDADALRLQASGASTVTAGTIHADALELEANGASTIALSGTTRSARVRVWGASKLVAPELDVRTATVEVVGASSGEFRVADSVEGEVSGASTLTVHGRPATDAVKTSGASTLKFVPAQ